MNEQPPSNPDAKHTFWRDRKVALLIAASLALLGLVIFFIANRTSLVTVFENNTPRASLTATAPTAPIKGLAGKCLDNAGKRAEDRNKIQLYTCNGSIAQEWTHYSDGRIVNKNGFCLDVKGAATTNSTIVQLYHCHGGAAQKWTYNATNKSLRNPHSGKCLDVRDASSVNRAQIQIYSCNNTAAQQWSAPKTASVTSNAKAIVGIGSKCLDNRGGLAANDNMIMLYHCTGSAAQQWAIKSDGQIVNANGYCLDIKGGKTETNTLVQLYQCNGTAAQKWTVNATAKTITNPQSGKCLTTLNNASADRTQIVIGSCSGAGAKWTAPASGSTGGGTTTPPPAPGGGGTPTGNASFKPSWSDEFNGSSLSFATDTGGGNWRTKGYEAGGSLNNGYVDFVGSNWNSTPSQVQQYGLANIEKTGSESVLSLKAKRNPGIPGVNARWIGVYLVSNHLNNLTWRYGYFEWRMRNSVPARGMFSTLWMFNNVPDRHNGYEGAELDMIEVFGSRTGSPWYAGVHFNPSKLNGLEGRNVATVNEDTKGWHRYGINWTPDKITYTYDGREIGSITGDQAAWFRNANLGLRMNYAMDPRWRAGSADFSTDNDPAPGTTPTMQVDYVRYYQTKPANLPGGNDDPYY